MEDNDLGLQDLIFQVKRDLLTLNPSAQARDPYPLFAIEKIELEIAVKVVRGHDGSAKISVLGFAEVGGGLSESDEHGNIIRVTLTPLIPHHELAAKVLADEKTREAIARDLRRSIIKSSGPLGGEPE